MDDVCIMETRFGALLTPEEEGKKNGLIVKLSKINIKSLDTNIETNYKERDERSEIDSTIEKECHTKNNEDWSPNAISCLLNAWRNCNKNAIECSKLDMDCTWKEISKEVSRCSSTSKKPKDCEQCKLKLKAMTSRYNREKMAKKFNANDPSNWEWYDTMNTLFIETPQSIKNLMDLKSIKGVIGVNDNIPSLITYYDVKDKYIEKHVVEENVSTKSLSIDVKGKLQDIKNEETFCTKVSEDKNMTQYNNLSTPISPRSPKSFMKVNWKDSSSPRLNFMDKFKNEEETCQESIPNSKPSNDEDEQRNFLLVDETKEKFMYGEQNTTNRNGPILDKKEKGALKAFDSNFDNSMSYNGNDVMDQDSTTSSPIVFKASQTKCKVNKRDDINSLIHKDGDDQHTSRYSVMELSRFINCNYKQTCIENVTNNRLGNENKEIPKERVSKVEEKKSCIFDNSRRQDDDLATNIGRGNEEMALSIARADSEAHCAKILSTRSPIASVTSQSESCYSSKKKKRLRVLSRYKYEQENRSTCTLITALMRASSNVPQFKKRIRFQARTSHVHEPNMVTALMTFGAMIQQLEKNHILLMERVLNEQSTVLNDFVKTLKYNDQIREAAMIGLIVRFLLSLFLIGIILYGTSKTTSSWMPISFQSSSWYGKSNNDYFSQLAWIGCFIIVIFTQLLWTSFKRRPIIPSHC